MKHLSISKQVCTALAVACLSFSATPAFAHGDEDHDAKPKSAQPKLSAQAKRVVTMLENYALAVESADITKIEKFMVTDENFTSIEGTFEDNGWKSYRKHLASELPMFNNTRYHLMNIRPYVKGKMAYATMGYAMKSTIKSDKFESGQMDVSMTGKATMVMIKSGNEWKIRHIHTVREQAKKPKSGEKSPH